MIRTFIAGFILGLLACGAGLYFVPAVDQYREASLIAVSPNGGTTEAFHINVPIDRMMMGSANVREPVPPGLEWPDDALFAGVTAELFKVRNSKDAVVGVASRVAADDPDVGRVIEWVLHLPARGSLFATMQAAAAGEGPRRGTLKDGTREFRTIGGELTERWVADASAAGERLSGRIELVTRYASSPAGTP